MVQVFLSQSLFVRCGKPCHLGWTISCESVRPEGGFAATDLGRMLDGLRDATAMFRDRL